MIRIRHTNNSFKCKFIIKYIEFIFYKIEVFDNNVHLNKKTRPFVRRIPRSDTYFCNSFLLQLYYSLQVGIFQQIFIADAFNPRYDILIVKDESYCLQAKFLCEKFTYYLYKG